MHGVTTPAKLPSAPHASVTRFRYSALSLQQLPPLLPSGFCFILPTLGITRLPDPIVSFHVHLLPLLLLLSLFHAL